MENDLTITEIRLIRSLLQVKTDAELAQLVGKPVEMVAAQISQMTGVIKRPKTKKILKKNSGQKTPDRSRNRPVKLSRVHKKVQPTSLHAKEAERALVKKKRLEQETFQTRKLDLSESIPVRLNNKTIVYVKPGTDIEKLRKQLNIK